LFCRRGGLSTRLFRFFHGGFSGFDELLDRVDGEREQEDDALDDQLHILACAEHDQPVLQNADQKNTCDRAGNLAVAAREADAAEHDGRHDVHLLADAGGGLPGVDAGKKNDGRQRAERGADHVGRHLHVIDADAGKTGRVGVGTDAVERAAVGCPVEDEGGQSGTGCEEVNRNGDAQKGTLAERAETVWEAEDRLRVADCVADALKDPGGTERGDDGGNLAVGDGKAVDEAHGEADQNAENQRDADAHMEIDHEIGDADADQRDLRADRKVHVAEQHDEHHADGHDAQRGDLTQNGQRVGRRKERGAQDGKQDNDRDHGDVDAQYLPLKDAFQCFHLSILLIYHRKPDREPCADPCAPCPVCRPGAARRGPQACPTCREAQAYPRRS